jgi:hypothetical protein
MKRSNYIVLMTIGIIATMLIPIVPCRAKWIWIGSEVSSGPTSGGGHDDYSGWSFEVSNISTSADSSGATASATCEAECWAEVYTSGGSVSRSPYASCASWGRSAYAWNSSPPSDDLIIDWSVDGSGKVIVAGWIDSYLFVTGDSGDSSAFAYGEIESYEYGNAWAQSSVSDGSNGSASIGVSGHATEDSSDVDDGYFEYYYAELYYNVEGGENDLPLEDKMQFTARAEVQVSVSCSASVSAAYWGNVFASSDAEADGSASVSVSW